MTKRGSPSQSRRERGIATRRRTIEAAYRLMSSRGYTQTTMADIAAEVGVAVQTVYFTFHNKPALMRAAFEFAVHGDHLPMTPIERPWFATLEAEPDIERALAIFVDANAAILHRVVPLASVIRAHGDDAELNSFDLLSERLRRDGFRLVLDALTRKRPLRPSLTPEDATTILLVLLGIDVYRSMVTNHVWAEDKWRSWVIETLCQGLFGYVADTVDVKSRV